MEFLNQKENSAINDYDYKFILENGTELNITNLNLYTNISIPIKNLELANYDYALYFSEFGYDIYDTNNNFYKNICTSAYYENNDIVINDRKKYIYPNNISLCLNNCFYKISDLDNKRIICECNLNNDNTSNINSTYNFEIEENYNFFSHLIDMTNYKLFKCYYLLSVFDNYKTNIIFYILLIMMFLYLFFIAKFFIQGISYIRQLTFKNIYKSEIEIKKYMNIRIRNKKSITYHIKIFKKKESKKARYSKKNITLKNTSIYQPLNLKKKSKIKKDYNKSKKINVNERDEIKIENKNDKNDQIDYNDLTFNQALLLDKRNIVNIFIFTLLEKISIIDLIMNKKTKIKDLLISQYILSLLLDFFFNAFLYSDDIVSEKYHNKGKLNFIISLLLSLMSNIITNIICYFLNYSKSIEDKVEDILEIKQEEKLLKILKKLLTYIKTKIIILSLFQIIIIIFCNSFSLIFFIVYSCSQISLLINYLVSLLDKIVISLVITIIVSITRKIGILYYNKYAFNVSNYINEHF